jgi:hypothetical protein
LNDWKLDFLLPMAADDPMRLGNLFSFGKEKTEISTNFLTFGQDFMKKVDVFGGDLFPPGKPRGDEDTDASTRKEPTKQVLCCLHFD